MTQIIHTTRGDYAFEPINLYHGRKRIDRMTAQENLLILREILTKTNIRWGLIFGTLLGAVREQDFIEHDEDTDIFIFEEHREELINLIHEFKLHDFEVARSEKFLLSIIRKNEYIDFYFFKRSLLGRRSGGYFVPRKYFSSNRDIEFFGRRFPTLNKPLDYLEYTYGEDWRIPRKNSHAEARPILWKMIIEKRFPFLLALYRSRRLP